MLIQFWCTDVMLPNKHTGFILSPIEDILKDAVSASVGVGNGIETFPLCDYVMQSVFLKMTGFQEQKMKCICWEMATVDYEFRYEFTKNPLGECSSYSEKQKIYKDLIGQIEKYGIGFSGLNLDRKAMLQESYSEVFNSFLNSNLSVWAQDSFLRFRSITNEIKNSHFASDKGSLFSGELLKKIYVDHLYRQRNRIAHNTPSYQQNLPTLGALMGKDHIYENYFIYFYVLVLIDKIFIGLYERYLEAILEREV